jgi:hypothetical protein
MVGFKTPRGQVTMPQLQIVVCVALACCASCSPTSDAPIITKYKTAPCIPLLASRRVHPDTREWNTALALRNGLEAVVSGAQVPGGRIAVSYPATGRTFVAADPGDYVYPSDVRFDAQNGLLYVKANGLAAGMSEETWLFEYDLRGQRITERRQVRNGILPAECPVPSLPQ